MKSHELIRALVEQGGGSLPVAKAMHAPNFQGTLHKICAGRVDSPSHASAERIAKHFKIPLEAIYDDKVATAIARDRGMVSGTPGGAKVSVEAAPPSVDPGMDGQIAKCIGDLASALDGLSDEDRERAASALITLARAPDSMRARAALLAAMAGAVMPDERTVSGHGLSEAALDLARQLDAIEDDAARRMAHRDASRAVSLHLRQHPASEATAQQVQPPGSRPGDRPHKRR
jgi:hypothetical protein